MNDEAREPRYSQDPENHPARNIKSVEATGAFLDRLTEGEKQTYANMFLQRLERLEKEMENRKEQQPEKPATEQIALRIPTDVLARWRATGQGWQTRMVQRLSAP